MGGKRPDPVDFLVGRRIRIERIGRAMSQTKLAQKIGVTFQQVQKYEKGANRVGAGRLMRIAKVLNVPVSCFFQGSGGMVEDKEATDSPVHLLALPGAVRLLRAYAELGSLRPTAIKMLEAIAADKKDKVRSRGSAAA